MNKQLIKVLKLNTTVTDSITGVKGHLSQMYINMDKTVQYIFQPNSLNDEGKPAKSMYVSAARVSGGILVEAELPLEVLGTEVTEKMTGYSGVASVMTVHLNGCIHFWVISKKAPKNGAEEEPIDCSILSLKGNAINKDTIVGFVEFKPQKKKAEAKRPSSPCGDRNISRRMIG